MCNKLIISALIAFSFVFYGTGMAAEISNGLCKSRIKSAKSAVSTARSSQRKAESLVRKKERKLDAEKRKVDKLTSAAEREIDKLNRAIERFASKLDRAKTSKETKLEKYRLLEESAKKDATFGAGACLVEAYLYPCKEICDETSPETKQCVRTHLDCSAKDNALKQCASIEANAIAKLKIYQTRRQTIEASENRKVAIAEERLNKAIADRDAATAAHADADYNAEAIAAAESALQTANTVLENANDKLAEAEQKYEEALAACPS